MGRRDQIADVGIRLIARGGTHQLTHRLVDTEAGLPKGSTSYYARTRRDLIALVVQRLSDESQLDVADVVIPETVGVEGATKVLFTVIQRMRRRAEAQKARFALMFELRDDNQLRGALTAEAPVRAGLEQIAARLLSALKVPDANTRAPELVALVDALLMYQAVDAAPIDIVRITHTYFTGLVAKAPGPPVWR